MFELSTYIQNQAAQKGIALMTHVVIGFPSLVETEQLIAEMVAAGADVIELQIPFSDPLADGPVIMAANDQALRQQVTMKDCLELMKTITARFDLPFLFMSYYQPIFHFGLREFCHQARQAGCAGLIVPDVPFDEEQSEGFIKACEAADLHHIRLLSPTTTVERLQRNAQVANGFVYVTARVGITGQQTKLDQALTTLLAEVRAACAVPIAVGFGISQPEQIRALRGHAEMAIAGSAVIEQIQADGLESVQPFIKHLRSLV